MICKFCKEDISNTDFVTAVVDKNERFYECNPEKIETSCCRKKLKDLIDVSLQKNDEFYKDYSKVSLIIKDLVDAKGSSWCWPHNRRETLNKHIHELQKRGHDCEEFFRYMETNPTIKVSRYEFKYIEIDAYDNIELLRKKDPLVLWRG